MLFSKKRRNAESTIHFLSSRACRPTRIGRARPLRCEPLEERRMLSMTSMAGEANLLLNDLQQDFGPQVISHTPEGTIAPIDSLTINFNEAIDPITFNTDDINIVGPEPTLIGSYCTNTYTHGDANNVTVSGSFAYVADYSRGLTILDISDPTSPELVSNYITNGYSYSVAISDTFAYMADSQNGLQVFDVSDPASPELVGNCDTNGTAIDVKIDGTLAYVADYAAGLQIIDISDPTSPTLIGNYNTSGNARGVTVTDTIAYVADGDAGLQVIDISDPYSPKLLSRYDVNGHATDVAISGELACVTDWDNGLQVIDISDPTSPMLIGIYHNTNGYAEGLVTSGTLAYVANNTTGLQIIDFSDPANPQRIGGYDTPNHAMGVAISESLVYVADYSAGILILDPFQEVSSITQVDNATWQINLTNTLSEGNYHVSVGPDITDLAGNAMDQDNDNIVGEDPQDAYTFNLYVDTTASSVPDNLAFTDYTGFSDDTLTSDTSLTLTWSDSTDIGGVAGYEYSLNGSDWIWTTGPTASVTVDEGENLFEVRAIDIVGNISSPATLTITVDETAPTAPTGLYLDDAVLHWNESTDTNGIWKYRYRVNGGAWLETDLLEAPTNLQEGQTALLEVQAFDQAGNISSSGTATLTVNYGPQVTDHSPKGTVAPLDNLTLTFNEPIDLTTLTEDDIMIIGPEPELIGSYDSIYSHSLGIAVQGSFAYVAESMYGLRIFDISDPTSPTRVGECDTKWTAHDVAVSGTIACVADNMRGMQIIDVSDPTSPRIIGNFNAGGNAYDVTISGTLAYVSFNETGVKIVDISDPTSPTLVGSYCPTVGYPRDVVVIGSRAYIAAGDGGFQILDVSDPSNPTLLCSYGAYEGISGVDVVDSLAFTSSYDGTVQILDISDPSSPTLLGSYTTSDGVANIKVAGSLAYLAANRDGLLVLNISDPTSPVLVGSYNTYEAEDLVIADNLVYFTDNACGLKIFQVTPEPIISEITQLDGNSYNIQLTDDLTEGDYQVILYPGVLDIPGNTMDQNANGVGGENPEDIYTFSFTVDATPPTIPGDLTLANDTGIPGDNLTNESTVTLTWSESVDASGIAHYEWRMDDGNWIAASELTASTLVTEGEHLFEVRATDIAGNVSQPATLTITVDNIPPSAPSDLYLDGSVLHWSAANENNELWKYQYRVNEGEWLDTDQESAQTDLANGQTALLQVRAIDKAGNESPTESITLTADYGPQVIDHSPEDTAGNVNAFVITFNEPIDPTTLTAEDINIQGPLPGTLVGHSDLARPAVDIKIVDSLAYLACQEIGLQIFDISNPTTPTFVGSYDTTGFAMGVTISGSLAYVADYNGGLQIIDISDPTSPTLVGNCPTNGYAREVTVTGSLAYVADSTYLQIIDISDPSAPSVVGAFQTSATVKSVVVSGTTAYIANEHKGLQILDVSDPSDPTLIGSYDTPGAAMHVTLSETLAYVADGEGGLQIIDVSDPTTPSFVANYSDRVGFINEVKVSNNKTYLADQVGVLQILDISDPTAPTLITSAPTGSLTMTLAISDDFAYVGDARYGLQILQIQEPEVPEVSSITQIDQTTWCIYLSSNLPYLGNDTSYSISIGPDITDAAGNGMDQNYNGISGEGSSDTYTFDLTIQPVFLPGDANLDGTVDGSDVTILAANWQAGVNTGTATWSMGDFNGDGKVDGSDLTILASNWQANYGPQVLDNDLDEVTPPVDSFTITFNEPVDPATLTVEDISLVGPKAKLIGSYSTGGHPNAVAISGSLAYVANETGIQIIDISDPANQSLIGSYNTSSYTYGVAVSDKLMYVADGGAGLKIVDISDPTSPTLLSSYNFGAPDYYGTAYNITLSGTLAYVTTHASEYGYLLIFDVSTPSSPTIIGSYKTSDKVWDCRSFRHLRLPGK